MATEFRITDVQKSLSKEVSNKYYSVFEDFWLSTSIASYACVKLNDFIVIKLNKSQNYKMVTLKNLQKKKDIISTLSLEVQLQMKEIKDELNLNQKELQKVKQTIDTMNTNTQDLNKKLKSIAIQVKQESDQEKLIEKYRKTYSNFNENITDELFELDDKFKDEVKVTFTHLTDLINDYQEKL